MTAVVSLLFVALVLLALALLAPAVAAEAPPPRDAAPPFAIRSTAREPVALTDYRGRVLVLLLMSSRCAACKGLAHGLLSELAAELDPARVAFLSVSVQVCAPVCFQIVFYYLFLFVCVVLVVLI